MTGWPDGPGPLAIPIDRWGHLPLPAHAMTAAEVGTVIAAHRTGFASLHTPRRRTRSTPEDAEQGRPILAPVQVSPEPDSGYYRCGVDARRRAHEALADVPGLVDDVEDRIEQLLRRTLDLLGNESEP
nr:hypothetical protein [Rhodococcus sp. 06-621-2]